MKRPENRLLAALLASLALHLLPLLPAIDFGQKSPSTAARPLTAELRPPPAAAPPLHMPEPAAPATEKAAQRQAEKPARPKAEKSPGKPPSPMKAAPPPADWRQAVRQHLRKLDAAGQFYPPEAIARGLEGEVVVLMVLDEAGKVTAARVEQGSGHALLDDAALRAVRSLSSLPADAPRQVMLPVRFRLR